MLGRRWDMHCVSALAVPSPSTTRDTTSSRNSTRGETKLIKALHFLNELLTRQREGVFVVVAWL